MNSSVEQIVREYLQRFRAGDHDTAFFGLLETDHAILPALMDAFRREREAQSRAFLVNVIWQHRQLSAVPFLEDVLHDPESSVWQEALDGLVAIGCPEALTAVERASDAAARIGDAELIERYEEAISQIKANLHRR